MISLEQAVNLVWHAFDDMLGGEIYVKKIPSMNIIDILKSISFKVSKFSSIIGRNGAGKTTLIRAIMNILPAKTGNIKFNDKVLNNLKTHDMSKLGCLLYTSPSPRDS